MNFVHPQLLYLALPVILSIVALKLHARNRRKKMLLQLLGSSLSDPAALKLSHAKRNIRFALLAAIMLLLVGVAARPYRSFRVIPHQTFGRDILVLFDVSKSMLSNDVAPSRMEHAKYLLREIVEKSGGDRFGIVAFAGRAFLACPLTADKTTLLQYIDELSPESIPIGGTDLERPIKLALEAFEAAAGNQAILLVTDGDELSGDSAAAIAKLKARHIPLFVVGLGDPHIASPIPEANGGFIRTKSGELATSRLNEDKLQAFARETGGIYIRSTVTNPGISQIAAQINRLDKSQQEATNRTIPYDDFPFLLAGALLLMLIYLLLGERPFKWRTIAPGVSVFLPLVLGAVTPEELYNQAREKQLSNDKESAALYEQAIKMGVGNSEVRGKSLFNLGVGCHQTAEQTLQKAFESLKSQQLDNAQKDLDNALKSVNDAQEYYRQSLADAPDIPNYL
ncbi:MAG: VWA domain-containing protein, partial [Victivallales bacterium]|nr:VWA domain-containing protein [Victivallales bacterium]